MKKLRKPGNVTDCMVGYEKLAYKKGFVFRVFQASTRPPWVSVEGQTRAVCVSGAPCSLRACLCSPEKHGKKNPRQRTLSIPQNPILFSYLVNNFMSSGFNAAGTWSTLFLSAYVRSFSSSSSSGFISFSAGSCWLSANDDRPSGKLSPNIQRTLCPLLCSNWAVGTRNT